LRNPRAVIEQRRVEGLPDPPRVSTSYAEHANLTPRMGSRRFTRLTNGFSKKDENHAHSVAIHTMHYNFVRIHQTLPCTPAMAARATATLWKLADMVKVLEVQGRLIRMTAYIWGCRLRRGRTGWSASCLVIEKALRDA
jgi:hypothetical protein